MDGEGQRRAVPEVIRYELKSRRCPVSDVVAEAAPRTPEEGDDTAIWLATLPDDGPTGGFYRDRKLIEW